MNPVDFVAMAKEFLVVFKKAGSNPDPRMEDGWLSIRLESRTMDQADRWGRHRAEKLGPWLKEKMEFVRVEEYRPKPEAAGIYRGLVLSLD